MSSDYTPPAVVTPTIGGAAGDGSLVGQLTAQWGMTNPPEFGEPAFTELLSGLGVTQGSMRLPNTAQIRLWQTSNGSRVALSMDAGNIVNVGDFASGDQEFRYTSAFQSSHYVLNPSGTPLWRYFKRVSGVDTEVQQVDINGKFSIYSQQATVGLGLSPIYGLDNRTGLTAADVSPITLYTATAANQLYRVSLNIMATAYTSGTATYTLTYTTNGVAKTLAITATALNTPAYQAGVLIRPDNGSAITVQLTGTFSATVEVAAAVEELV